MVEEEQCKHENSLLTLFNIPHQRQRRIREDHKSFYAISTTYVYGQEKYLLVCSTHSSSPIWFPVNMCITVNFVSVLIKYDNNFICTCLSVPVSCLTSTSSTR